MIPTVKYFDKRMLAILLCLGANLFAQIPFYNRSNTQEMHQFLSKFLRSGDVVFDVGANIGQKTAMYLDCGARVICFEPQLSCVNQLQKKYKGNDAVSIEQVGLSFQSGFLELLQCDSADTIATFSKDYVATSRFAQRDFKWDKKSYVEVTTLDAMIAKWGKPRFCKIDVENFEFEVLQGLTEPIDYLSFECNSEYIKNTEKCVRYLASLGYEQFNFAIGERGWFTFDQWVPADSFIANLHGLMQREDWEEIWGLWGDVYARL